jgi:dethiobiotin synthetase
LRGLFVTGTDTGVGKSVLSAAICAALVARGEHVTAFKPVVTGLDEPAGDWPFDHELLASVTGQQPEEVSPYRFGLAASPHLAGEVDPDRLLPPPGDPLVMEGVGGLLVPLTEGFSVRDLCVRLRLPLLIAARPGLGTINHTLLTVEAARNSGLEVRGVVLTPWPEQPGEVEVSNRSTIERVVGVTVSTLPATRPDHLAEAGARLPVGDWLRHTPSP